MSKRLASLPMNTGFDPVDIQHGKRRSGAKQKLTKLSESLVYALFTENGRKYTFPTDRSGTS